MWPTVPELAATMRDGTVLRADVYRPPGTGPWPVLLARTPYGKGDPGVLARLDPPRAAARGHLVVVQDCRGRYRSEGDWTPLAHEAEDGYDTVRWAARLPGADGRVCTYGPSYLGHTQWAAAGAAPPELLAAVPEFTWSSPDDGLVSRGGAYELGLMTQWTLTLGRNVLARRHAADPAESERQLGALEQAIEDLPARTYWELPAQAPLRRFNLPTPTGSTRPEANIPMLIIGGWYDAFLHGTLENYGRLRASGIPAALIVGPWTHDDQTGRVGDIDFGPAADAVSIDGGASLLDRELDWLDVQLERDRCGLVREDGGDAGAEAEREAEAQARGEARAGADGEDKAEASSGAESEAKPADQQPPVLLFVMGVNQWRTLPDWPPECVETPWYLHESGGLSTERPAPDSPSDEFLHDPRSPVPTCGGATLLPPEYPPGPWDQRQIELREDVLVYTSAPLESALEVIGRIRLHLTAESTADSADWIARLCDVDADGVSRNIADGILRTSEAGDSIVDLWSTAHVFLPGHRIRLQVASSCFPRWDRSFGAARQRVHHDAARPSRLILPVVV
jgi:predicted acyl esterase